MRTVLPLLAALLIGMATLPACRGDEPRPPQGEALSFRAGTTPPGYANRIDSVDLALQELAALPSRPEAGTAQRVFRRVRAAYKRIEYRVEYDHPPWAAALNGPPIPIVDEDDPTRVIRPSGFQVIEGVVFPRPSPNFKDVVRHQVELMRRVLGFIRADSTEVPDPQRRPFDAARMELARIATLGLAGFDATLSRDGIREAADALKGFEDGLGVYEGAMRRRDPAGWDTLHRSVQAAATELERSPDFERFDRLPFIVRFLSPIATALDQMQRSLQLPAPAELSPWHDGATNIYAADALSPRWFAPDYAPPATPELVALGRRLFFDPTLSRRGQRSCATCHDPARAFTDGRRKAAVDAGHGRVRNTPTLLNAGLQLTQFADQRVRFLEFQFGEVMANPREMALSPDSAAEKLGADSGLVAQFVVAFGKPRPEAVTGKTLSIAVAAYVRSLQGLNSRFDRAVRGDTTAITAAERRGFNLFMGKAGCGTCHFAPLFGGTLPPKFLESEPEVIGVPVAAPPAVSPLDPDVGVFAIDHAPLHRHAFKTPTLRNVALTAPYMHNGVFRTLEKVVDFYDRGGGRGLGLRLPNQTLPSERLHLSRQQKRDLVAFLGALTDSAYATPASPAQHQNSRVGQSSR